MRKLTASTFASLDGIMQAPGGPEADPTGGFTLGGWMFAYVDESMDISASGFDGKDRELLQTLQAASLIDEYESTLAVFLKRESVIRPFQRSKAVKTTGIAAARVTPSDVGFPCEIATRARASLIDCATDADTDGSFECNAAPGVVAGTPHVCASTEDRVIVGKCGWHPPPRLGIEFLT